MQMGSLIQTERQRSGPVWEYRWREPGPNGNRKHRRIVVGSTEQYAERDEAVHAVAALRQQINAAEYLRKFRLITFADLIEHYRQRELGPSGSWKSYSTKIKYDGYIKKWICPRWGSATLSQIKQERLSNGYTPCLWRGQVARRSATS